ncbi:cardiolipin synthase [Pelagibius sp. CAU 1746]|uniref:cardiolipin synthase n=1 Tax=Pelagibius sp. CAU 1746 TaxID=3140370 RepID=UPI00325BB111
MTGWFADNLSLGLGGLAVFIHLSGIASALHAAMRTRTAQGAVAWSILLVTFPYVALPLYWVFGRGKFHGYVAARRSGDLEIHHVAATLQQRLASQHRAALPQGAESLPVFEKLAGTPFCRGNEVEILKNGEAAYGTMFSAIDAARAYVLLQVYLLRDDDLGRDLKARLARRAQDGLRVLLLYDEIGSYGLPRSYVRELQDAGATVAPFGTTQGPVNRFQLNFRNHRKILVVDGREAFVGGLNFGDEYLGRNVSYGPWRDTHLRIFGPVVQAVQLSFVEDWFWATREVPELAWETEAAQQSDVAVLALPTGPADLQDSCELFFLEAIRSARKRIWLASPYFAPDEQIMAALELARLRGVEVRLLLPGRAEHRIVHMAGFAYYPAAERVGIQIYRYQPGFLHQKVLLVDDTLASVGTANLDNRSFRLNFELSILIWDHRFALQIEKMLLEDFAQSRKVAAGELDDQPIWFRIGVSLSRLLGPVL